MTPSATIGSAGEAIPILVGHDRRVPAQLTRAGIETDDARVICVQDDEVLVDRQASGLRIGSHRLFELGPVLPDEVPATGI